MNWNTGKTEDLLTAIISLRSLDEAKMFFRDLLSEKEISEMASRWQAARMLDRGVPYRRITVETGLSSRTVARIAKWLRSGLGGYRLAIDRRKRQK